MPIVETPFEKTLYGLSGTFQRNEVWNTAKPLMDRMWKIIKDNKLATEGINHWIYSGNSKIFVGVVIATETNVVKDLEKRHVQLKKYALWNHKGSFSEIGEGYKVLREEILKTGNEERGTSIEIYGHVSDSDPRSEMSVLIEIS